MNTAATTMQQAQILTINDVKMWRKPLPKGWREAAGMLQGEKHIPDPVAYQKAVRQEWEDRLQRQMRFAETPPHHDD